MMCLGVSLISLTKISPSLTHWGTKAKRDCREADSCNSLQWHFCGIYQEFKKNKNFIHAIIEFLGFISKDSSRGWKGYVCVWIYKEQVFPCIFLLWKLGKRLILLFSLLLNSQYAPICLKMEKRKLLSNFMTYCIDPMGKKENSIINMK